MIYYRKGIYWEDQDAQIIFNPVSIYGYNPRTNNKFIKFLKRYNNEIYCEYENYISENKPSQLLSDIQLVSYSKNRVILNAFVCKNNNINLLALTKTLVETFNIAEEYKLDVVIPLSMIEKKKETVIYTIVNTIFEDFKQNVYIY